MYSTFLAKPHFKSIVRILQNKQLNFVKATSARSKQLFSPFPTNVSAVRLYSDVGQFGNNMGNNKTDEAETSSEDIDDVAQNLNFRELMMYNVMDDRMKMLNSCDTSNQVGMNLHTMCLPTSFNVMHFNPPIK